MNRHGLFCFVLLLAFFAVEAGFFAGAGEASHSIAEAGSLAFEAEKTSFTRALVENSVDAVVKESLRQALVLNLGQEETKKHVNSRLALLFTKIEKAYSEEIEVKFDFESIQESFLNENSSVLVTKLKGKALEAEYCFTAGVMKNRFVEAEITGGKVKQFFKMPAGYTVKKEVVG